MFTHAISRRDPQNFNSIKEVCSRVRSISSSLLGVGRILSHLAEKVKFTYRESLTWHDPRSDSNTKLKLGTGIQIAVPIPKEHFASGSFVESAIQRALTEAREQNIRGSAETPFLLSKVNELTGGASLTSGIL
ncbi:hypothetical protein BVRB_8g199290 [Beta vulgaris subsp. vulgaris]|nr:hypothetical protein BVRB_8g199290 [Beta vulgaris subsp. vulgaris]